MLKNSLKKLVSLMSIIAMFATTVPAVGAVTLNTPVQLGSKVIIEQKVLDELDGKEDGKITAAFDKRVEGAGTFSQGSSLTYKFKINAPLADGTTYKNNKEGFVVFFDKENGKAGASLTANTFNTTNNTFNMYWKGGKRDYESSLGTFNIGEEYTVLIENTENGMNLMVSDADGKAVVNSTGLGTRNVSEPSVYEIITTARSADDPVDVEVSEFKMFTSTGADEVVVSIDGTELNATGNAAIDVESTGTGENPIVFDAVVKQAGEDVSENYNVVYALKSDVKGVVVKDNKLTVTGVAEAGTLNPVVVVSLTNADGTEVYDSFATIEMNLNKAEATPQEYLDGFAETLVIKKDGKDIKVDKHDVYDCGDSFDVDLGDGVAKIEWKCYMKDKDGDWEKCDAVNFKTGEYTSQANYDDTFLLKAIITHADDASAETEKEFECKFYNYDKEIAEDYKEVVDFCKELAEDTLVDDIKNLPVKGEYGSTISWSSSNPSVISNTGEVTRKTSDKTVRFTATIEKGNAEAKEHTVELTVKAKKSASGGSSGGSGGGTISSSSLIGIVNTVTATPKPAATPAPTAKPADAFTDLDSAAWAKTAITELANRYVVNGKTATTFAPNDDITRAEFAKILITAFGLVNPNATVTSLSDVTDSSAWYYQPIASAYAKGIITGYADGSFGINDKVTRQDMAVMVYRAAKSANVTMNIMKEEVKFTDADQIGDYAKEAVTALQRAGVINGVSDTEFAPTATATRAQAAQMVYGLIK